MKHAASAALDALEPLLEKIRAAHSLTERSRGVFYRKGRALLHFHEDSSGLFADVRGAEGSDFERIRVDAPEGEAALLARVALLKS
ncbi:MAG: hypothetical protein ACRED9_12925 [Caulobacteraceae bacterium]